jgi:hypothetical protein
MPTKTTQPRRTTRPKRSETYVCVESFAGNDVMVSAGTRLRGNHEIVKKYGHYFVREVSGEDIEGLIASRRVELARAVPETREEAPPPEPEPPAKGKVRRRGLSDGRIRTAATPRHGSGS